MNPKKTVLTAVVIGCCTPFCGCEEFQKQISLLQNKVNEPMVDESLLPPITVTFGPTKTWFRTAIESTQFVNFQPNELLDENLANTFPGLDVNRPGGAAIYFSDNGSLEPLVLIPITDYETLLNKIATLVPLQRAAASSFDFLGLRLKIMQRGDYAAFVVNLKTMDRIPEDVSLVLGHVDEQHDMTLQVHRGRFPEGWQDEILSGLTSWLPCKSMDAIGSAERLTVGVSFSKTNRVPFELTLDSAQTDDTEAVQELTDWLSEQIGVKVVSQLSESTILWRFKLDEVVVREQIKVAQSTIENSLASRKSAFAHLRTMKQSADTAPIFGPSFGSGASPRRS